jgi:simple sugar transport system permease protein
MIDLALLDAIARSTVTMAVPLLLAALGELLAERAGIINIGLEGMVIAGAFAAMVGTWYTGWPAAGITLGLVVGGLAGALLAAFTVGIGANQVVAGTALTLLAYGLTGVAYRAVFGVTGAALTVAGSSVWAIPGLHALPVIGAPGEQTMLGYLAFALVPALAFGVKRTVPGLQLRMSGENPRAAETQGVPVQRVRTLALVACGALAAAAGAFLVVAYARTFVEGMSAGRGFIALAIVIVGRWSPWGIVSAALLFGLATALQFHFQALGLDVPYQFFLALPYVLTLLVLAGYAGRAQPPAGLGQPYVRE